MLLPDPKDFLRRLSAARMRLYRASFRKIHSRADGVSGAVKAAAAEEHAAALEEYEALIAEGELWNLDGE